MSQSSRESSFYQYIDWYSIGLYLVLVLIGWVAIYASSYDEKTAAGILDFSKNYGMQFIWIIGSLTVLLLVFLLDSRIYISASYFLYGLGIVLLIAVLFFGAEINGSKSWFRLGPASFQPAELAKVGICFAMAKLLSTPDNRIEDLGTKLICVGLILVPQILIILQGDLGSALVFTSLSLVMFRQGLEPAYPILGIAVGIIVILALLLEVWIVILVLVAVAGFLFYQLRKTRSEKFLLIPALIISIGLAFSVDFAFNNFLESYQQERIMAVFGKSDNNWNLLQSKIAIGAGGFLGQGFLQGTQTNGNFVPEQSTDFIFSTIGEEFGFVGALVLLGTYLLLLIRLTSLAERQRSLFAKLYGYGVVSILFFHFAVNIGMTIGLVPVIGIPLPFISYGGSSLLSFTLLIAIFLKLDAQRLMVFR